MGLLLDEPTTHLDRNGVDYLIEELRYYYGTLIFVSHDRYFLNKLATKIWEVKDGQITEYIGNYDAYKQQKEIEELEQDRLNEKHIKERNKLEIAISKKRSRQLNLKKYHPRRKNRMFVLTVCLPRNKRIQYKKVLINQQKQWSLV